jgi:hypothetical protein
MTKELMKDEYTEDSIYELGRSNLIVGHCLRNMKNTDASFKSALIMMVIFFVKKEKHLLDLIIEAEKYRAYPSPIKDNL